MRDANLYDGDLIVIDRAEVARHDSIVVAVLNGEFVVKRLYTRNGELKLVSENKAYAPIVITEGMDFEVWGVVTHTVRKAR